MSRDPRTDPQAGDVLYKRKKQGARHRFTPFKKAPTVRYVTGNNGKRVTYDTTNGVHRSTDLGSFLEWSARANVLESKP